jgi:filamentous hemagglutinin family protein
MCRASQIGPKMVQQRGWGCRRTDAGDDTAYRCPMNRHASMNRAYRLIWSAVREVWIPVAERTRGRGKRASRALVAAALSLGATFAQAGGPSGGQVTAGSGSIAQSGALTTITQNSPKLSLSWSSFNIAPQDTVNFVQPSASAIAVNRIFDTNGTQILGHLNANGQIFLINPNGILFGPGAELNVAGLVATTLQFTAESADGTYSFSGSSAGAVVNEGTINAAPGGYIALMASHVSNQGVISAQLGSIALAAGTAATLTFSENSLVRLQVDQSLLHSLAENSGLLRADGGQVLMTAGARDALVASVVNNTGVIEARTVGSHEGSITLFGGMSAGTVHVGGTLDASAPDGGNGGFIETSAAHVEVANDAKVTTAAASGLYGSWLIDPTDFTIAASGGDETGAELSSALTVSNVTIASSDGASGTSGNINVNDTVSWSANTLALNAYNNININSALNGSGSASLALRYGQGAANGVIGAATATYNVNAPVNLPAGPNFGTQLGSSGPMISYTVITSLGAAADAATAPTTMTLQGMAATSGLGGNYALGSNIDASPTGSPMPGWNAGAGFTPIGTTATPFTGMFDGLGHTISNLTINRPSTDYVGLFGVAGNTSVIQNVGMVGGSVTGGSYVGGLVGRDYGSIAHSYTTGAVTGSVNASSYGSYGSRDVGGLVGDNHGSISSSHATGTVNGIYFVGGLVGVSFGTISNSYATGAVTGSSYVGGLVGGLYGYAVDLYATGAVSGSASYARVGGLVGSNSGTISNSYATGAVTGGRYAGGLAGVNYGTVSTSYATGSVSGSCAGGLLGFTDQGTIIDSYATGAVSGGPRLGGLVASGYGGTVTDSYWNTTTSGQTGSYQGTGLTTSDMQSISNFVGFVFTGTPGAAGNNWVMVDADGSLNNAGGAAGATFPMLASEYSTTVTNAHQLQLMAMDVTATYTLSQNIDASATTLAATSGSGDIWSTAGGFIPIGSNSNNFTGSFDGAGYTINSLTINRPAPGYDGLFGVSTGAIQNVGLVGGSVTGGNTGALVALNYGSITNSYATVDVNGSGKTGGLVGINVGTITNSYATGNVSGGTYVGGLVGRNAGSISASHATGNVSGSNYVGGLVGYALYGDTSNSYASGVVTGVSMVGGLIGFSLNGIVTGSYASGNVSGGDRVGGLVGQNYGFGSQGSISYSYATGVVTGTTNAGGLVGSNNGATISNSYATGNVAGTSNVGGLVGDNGNGSGIYTSYATGGVTGNSNVGGLVGANYGAIANGSYATGAVTGTGSNIGGLVGSNAGQISISHATGAVTGGSAVGGLLGSNLNGLVTGAYASGNVSGGDSVGGLIGHNYGAASQVSINYGSATGVVTGTTNVGGLVGSNNGGAINNSYATGNVLGTSTVGGLVGDNGTGSAIYTSYATGIVTGNANIGGLAGANYGVINNGYATGAVTGTASNIGGLVGLNNGSGIGSSHATGVVTGGSAVGGLIGSSVNGYVYGSYASGNVSGGDSVGGLIGSNIGIGEQVSITNSYATGVVTATSNAGGLVGTTSGAIASSYATGAVTGTANNIGGLVGSDSAAFVYSSHASGNVSGGGSVGGLVGQDDGDAYQETVYDSYATGTVIGTASNIGGLVGFDSAGAIINSHATGTVTGGSAVGGLIGINVSGAVSGSYASGSVTGGDSVGGLIGHNYGIVSGNEVFSSLSNTYATGVVSGTTNAGGLVGLNDNGAISTSYATGNVSGTDDVGGLLGNNASALGGEIVTSYATGVVTGSANVGGLAGANNGTISSSYESGAVTGTASNIGGLVGLNNLGVVLTSHATGAVTGATVVGGLIGSSLSGVVIGSYASGSVTGGDSVGGLIGQNYGNAPQSLFNGSVRTSYASGIVTGTTHAGGLVGSNFDRTISNSYATGNVSGTGSVGGLLGYGHDGGIANTYATGSVTGTTLVGGLVGDIYDGPITNSHATGVVIGTTGVGGLVGQNTTGATVTGSFATGNVSGSAEVGGLAGNNVSGSTIVTSYATGAVSATNHFVGGLVGNNYGAISKSYATGVVVSTAGIVGGLAGSNYGAISNSYATGSVTGTTEIGGLVGANYLSAGTVSNSYAAGNVHATTTLGTSGGLVGDNTGTITASFWNSDINEVGIGSGATTGASGLSSAGMMTMSNFSGAGWSIADTGASGAIWRIYAGNTAPLLLSFLTPLSVTAGNVSQTYGDAPIANLSAVSYSLSGAATSGNLFNLNNAYSGAINVGSYAPSLYSDQQGYDISYAAGTLTINPATLTVTANAGGRIYGQANPQPSGTVTGFVGTDTLASVTSGSESFATSASASSPVGSYAITGSGLTAENGNYIFSPAAGNATAFSIQPATLTYTAAASSFTAGKAPAGLSGTLSGFVLADSQASATAGTLLWTTTAAAGSQPGRYAIDGGGLTATNYVFVEATGNATALTVQAGVPPVTPPVIPPVTPPVVLPVTPPVIVDLSGAASAALGQAQIAAGTLEAELPASQTDMSLSPPELASDIALAPNPNFESGVDMDKRVVIEPMVTSLRIVHGGVKLPANLVDVNAAH